MVFEREQAVAHRWLAQPEKRRPDVTHPPYVVGPPTTALGIRTHARPRTPILYPPADSASGGTRLGFGVLSYWFLDFGDGNFKNRAFFHCNTTYSTHCVRSTRGLWGLNRV